MNEEFETLKDLRVKLGIPQTQLAARMGVKPSSLAQVEVRKDLHVSMLRGIIEGLGGRLEIKAVFPEFTAELGGFSKVNSLVEELRALLQDHCLLHPMPPDRENDQFAIREVTDSIVTLDKLSNGQRIEIPLRRIAELIPGTPSFPLAPPTIVLRGSMKWSALRKVWEVSVT